MRSKESGKVRYAYGVAMALLLGGTAFSLATGQAGAQVAQNAPGTSALAPRPGAPMSFADLAAQLQPAVVNISTKQRVPVSAARPIRSRNSSAGSIPTSRSAGRQQRRQRRRQRSRARARRLARLGLHHLARRLHRHQQPPDPGPDRHRHGRQRHGHDHRPHGISGADRRPRRDVRPRAAQDRRRATCRSSSGATAPRRGSATG